ncbi:MAG: hypothetical protein PHH09_01405 [Methanoregulaceae archaeon]|nr:hypothetical protein [Methanoregulaceae archaeon]MDD5047567.1 hypothetical protein [Methanoregulaceae archaeon]
MRRHWQFIGDERRVADCEWLGVGFTPICRSGECPGNIDGDCPFKNAREPEERFREMFRQVIR